MTNNRELLFAVIAQQLGYVNPKELIALGRQWMQRRLEGAHLRDLFIEKKIVLREQVELVDALVDEVYAQSNGDETQALQSLPLSLARSVEGLESTLVSSGAKTLPASIDPGGEVNSLETSERLVQEVNGRYTMDTGLHGRAEELGRGGVGRVVVARDHVLQREVAVKELLNSVVAGAALNPNQLAALEARFLREARVTGQLEHPAIVPVYEVGRRLDGSLYYTMKRVRGRTLHQAISDARTYESRLAFLGDFVTICRAIASAHHHGVIHRDLKPQNIMLGGHGEAYVMDWGLARVMGRDTVEQKPQMAPDVTGARAVGAMGTPSYMSPEQARGHVAEVDERSDIWGLGAILFELITGRPPYIGPSPMEVVAMVRETPVPVVRSLEPQVAPELAAICQKALRKNRARRYASATELANDVQAFLDGERVSAYRYTVGQVLQRLVTRHQRVFISSIIIALILLSLSSIELRRLRIERDQTWALARVFPTQLLEMAETNDDLSTSTLESLNQVAEGLATTSFGDASKELLVHAYVASGSAGVSSGLPQVVMQAVERCRPLVANWYGGNGALSVLAARCSAQEGWLLARRGRAAEARLRLEQSVSQVSALTTADDATSRMREYLYRDAAAGFVALSEDMRAEKLLRAALAGNAALAQPHARGPRRERLRLVNSLLELLLRVDRVAEAAQLATEVTSASFEGAGELVIARLELNRAQIAARRGDVSQAKESAARASALYAAKPPTLSVSHVESYVESLVLAGRVSDAANELKRLDSSISGDASAAARGRALVLYASKRDDELLQVDTETFDAPTRAGVMLLQALALSAQGARAASAKWFATLDSASARGQWSSLHLNARLADGETWPPEVASVIEAANASTPHFQRAVDAAGKGAP